VNNQVTNFTNGFPNGVTLRGVPVLNTYSGKVFFVSNSGSNLGYNGTYESPFQTLTFALTQCTADKGDIIFLMPGYTEAISSAAELTVDKAGVSIIGLGSGSDRPTFTFDTATTASILVSADNVTIENVLGVAGIDGLINPFNVTGDNLWADLEWQDASAAVEAARAMLLTGSSNSVVNLKYTGFTVGNAVVNAIRLVGCTNVFINIDAYGVCTTAWVQFLTTASINVTVNGQMYTQGITNLSRDVVDTVSGSTGWVSIFDTSAGVSASGGSATSWVLGSDDVSSIGATVTLIAADIGDPSAAGTTLDAEIRTGYNSSSIASNADGSVLERLEYLQANLVPDAQGFFATGNCDPAMTPSTTSIVVPSLIGYGNGFFANKYYMQVILDGVTAGNAPETQVQLITAYTSSTGTFTTNAFGTTVKASSVVGVIHESVIAIGRNDSDNAVSTSSVASNADGSVLEREEYIQNQVNKIDQAALSASPVAGSLSNFISGTTTVGTTLPAGKSLVDVLGNPTADTLTSITAKLGNPAAAIGTTLGTVNTNTANTVAAVINGSGTQIATNKSLVDALGTTGSAINDSAVSIAGMIGPNNANNAFDSTLVVADENGSVMERLEFIQANFTNAPVIAALGTDGTTVTDSATTVLGATGANNANNAFSSAAVVANADGSVLERLETIQSTGALTTGVTAALGTDGTTVTDSATTVLGAVGANNANNAFDSSAILPNIDGSLLERDEFMQQAVAAVAANASIAATQSTTAATQATTAATQSTTAATQATTAATQSTAAASSAAQAVINTTVAPSATSLSGAIGTEFGIKKTLTSSAITTSAQNLTTASTGGELLIKDIIIQTDSTGLAGGTLMQITSTNAKGNLTVFTYAVATLGGNATGNFEISGIGTPFVLESGANLQYNMTGINGTGAGTADVRVICERLAAGATMAAA
jgi:hypothetical protein